MRIQSIVEAQRAFFETGATLPVRFRKDALKKLRRAVLNFEPRICDALAADLGKSRSEAYMTEIGMTLSEISWMLKHVRSLARRKRVRTPLAQFAASTYRLPSPYGTALVMSPWNYPFMLSVEPVVDALAAGNTVIVKPSAYAPATSKVLQDLFASCLPAELVAVVTGGRNVNSDLLDTQFDTIFFTGSKAVGQIVLNKAAKFWTPVTLELGGKSPCIVDETANLALAAKRIVFGKYLNAGQTCVAPDYVLVHQSVKNVFLDHVKREIIAQFGEHPLENKDYGRIVNKKHFTRLQKMLKKEDCFFGGQCDADALRIEPTVLDNVHPSDPCMEDEIFGPIMPVLTYETQEDVKRIINEHPTPLALYVFTSNGKKRDALLKGVRFGGGCVNDTIIHLATSAAGFGGVGSSGMGAYHGQTGFDAFTHYKTIVDKKTWMDLPMRYQPYAGWKDALIRLFVR